MAEPDNPAPDPGESIGKRRPVNRRDRVDGEQDSLPRPRSEVSPIDYSPTAEPGDSPDAGQRGADWPDKSASPAWLVDFTEPAGSAEATAPTLRAVTPPSGSPTVTSSPASSVASRMQRPPSQPADGPQTMAIPIPNSAPSTVIRSDRTETRHRGPWNAADSESTVAIPIVAPKRSEPRTHREPIELDQPTPAFGIALPTHLPPPPFTGTPAWPTIEHTIDPTVDPDIDRLPTSRLDDPQPLSSSSPAVSPSIADWRPSWLPTDPEPRSYLTAAPAPAPEPMPEIDQEITQAIPIISAPESYHQPSEPSVDTDANHNWIDQPDARGYPGTDADEPTYDDPATVEPATDEFDAAEYDIAELDADEFEPADQAGHPGDQGSHDIPEAPHTAPEPASSGAVEGAQRPSARATAYKSAPTFSDVVLAYVPPYPEPIVPVRPVASTAQPTHEPSPATTPKPASQRVLPPTPEEPEWLQRRQVSADEITHDAIVEPDGEVPRRGWRARLFSMTGGRVNPGISPGERAYLDVLDRIRRPVRGARQIAVSSIKGGVGKTTVSACLGHMLAEYRGDGVIAVDADPDAGNLADRLTGRPDVTVRHLLADLDAIRSLSDFGLYTSLARRLRVLAGNQDPAMGEAFSRNEYERVCDTLTKFFDIVITDSGTGLVHDAMAGVLARADRLIVVGSPTVDGASRASKTLDWLLAHGHERLADDAIVVLSGDRASTKVNYSQLRSHFRRRSQHVIEVPSDPHLYTGGIIEPSLLQPETRKAYLELAAVIADGFEDELFTFSGHR